jgi:hypothetical protein
VDRKTQKGVFSCLGRKRDHLSLRGKEAVSMKGESSVRQTRCESVAASNWVAWKVKRKEI